MRILVTGGAGFIGSNLISQLIAETDHEIVNLDKLTYAGNPASLSSLQDHPRYRFEKLDICDAAVVNELMMRVRPEAVMHLAAESHVDRSIDGPGEFMQTNILGTYHLLQAALVHWQSLPSDKKERFRFLHVSTDEVYGSLAPDDKAFSETTGYDPHSPYGASKAASDHLVRAWGTTYGLPFLLTNCSNNYGPRQYPEKLIPTVILRCLRNEPIPVYGKGENIRDWLHVDDHCRALRTVCDKGTPGRTYNIGGNCELQNIDLVRAICAILDELSPSQTTTKKYADLITYVTDRPGHDLRYAIDCSRIHDELGWSPKATLDSGMRETVQWYLDNQAWVDQIENGTISGERIGTGQPNETS
ncbi:MAG: dTDP-glucose 4,6-dehydratase [Akkermansiaceae bacterium]|nr:dTDP-glucose 4,6-dehydratase [Akkermansiaceae bacterium]